MIQTAATTAKSRTATSAADVVREYGPFAGVPAVHGVTFDGRHAWAATGSRLIAIDPASGAVTRTLECACDAGTAFDGQYFYQVAGERIDKIDPVSGAVVGSIPAPDRGAVSGLAWAEGSLWVGQYRGRKIHQVDPADGAVLRSVETDRFVTGVTWVDGDLWHGTWDDDQGGLCRVDPQNGALLEHLEMPRGTGVSGLESDGAGYFYCGGGSGGTVGVVRRPARAP